MKKKPLIIITTISTIVFILVAILYTGIDIHSWRPKNIFLFPKINAWLNSITTLLIITGLICIKLKKTIAHRYLMSIAFILSSVFLVLYVIYHSFGITVLFADLNGDGQITDSEKDTVGNIRYFYYFILLTHIVLSTLVLPLVLYTFYSALSPNYKLHKKLAKFTFPIWLYVTFTGVLVYILIHPYYDYITVKYILK